MTFVLGVLQLGLVMVSGTPSPGSIPVTAANALNQFCEPLIGGSTAAQVTESAKASGFKSDQVGGHPVLVQGELILSVSDAPPGMLGSSTAQHDVDTGYLVGRLLGSASSRRDERGGDERTRRRRCQIMGGTEPEEVLTRVRTNQRARSKNTNFHLGTNTRRLNVSTGAWRYIAQTKENGSLRTSS